ncbi:HAD-like domain [Phytophthora cactorum]|nr:HAD-like domain [Phytophthora cactorum]
MMTMPATPSKTQSNLNASLANKQLAPIAVLPHPGASSSTLTNDTTSGSQTPTKLLADLNITNPLATIIHRADKNGKQQPILTGARRVSLESFQGSSSRKTQQRGSLHNVFLNIWSALGLHEQQQQQEDLEKAKQAFLPPVAPNDVDKKCLVLDLDETLVHSSFRPTDNYDFIIPVDIDGTIHHVYVCKRPGAEEFLIEMAKYYEIVVYTASLSKYADPLLDKLDPEGVIRYRLYREHCVQYEDNIVDNSPMAYAFHPRNAIGCSSFIDDPNDRELESIARFLTKFQDVEDVCNHMQLWDANY